MNKLDLCNEFIKKVMEHQQIEELFKYTTRDSKYYCIEDDCYVDLESFVKKIEDYKNCDFRTLECDLFVKFLFENSSDKLHVYFEVKKNKIIRIEYSKKI